ncbi:hypothetical protein [Pseudarthrobacter oxydans]|jgi:hypothetical protein|uniref:hypothetical protein n=1 Tax=Pseudarthrobacter oxydans TaxID=1671 RepID=UPI0035E4CFEB|nr:hypothetical protein GCM10017547_19840 [Pseudarthrobacter oxydans]BFE45363.1 hypothetical protein GCM10017547_32560 [Pseudarthrobacter oxydans]
MMLTAYVKTAGDHHFLLGIEELPGVEAVAISVRDIPAAVQAAAAAHTGHPKEYFTVAVDY